MIRKNLFSFIAAGTFLAISFFAYAEEASDVIVLNKSNFKSIVEPEKLILVEFYAPWCGHCKNLAPEYEKAATALKVDNIKLAKIDCTAEAELCKEYDIKGYPTMKVFKSNNPTEYEGSRDADQIISYMKEQSSTSSPEDSEASDVLILGKSNFTEIVEPEKLILVEFYAPWCGHCKALAPEYEKAATDLKAENIKIAKVDCTVETEICNDHEVRGYPTLKVFKHNKSSDYNGGRKTDLIVSYMKKQSLPAVTDVTLDTLDTFKESDRVVIIGFWNEKSQSEHDIFNKVAEKLRDDFLFGQTGQIESAVKAGVSPPAIVLYKKFDEGKNVLEDSLTEESLTTFIKTNSVPLLDEIGPENYGSYVDSGLPIAYLFYENPEQRKELGDAVEPVAKEFKGQLNFVYIDATKYGQHAENVNLKLQWPAFGIQKPEEGTKYPFDQSLTITTDEIRSFVSRFIKGEIKPSIKSAPIPENNDGPVTILVADNFEDIVFDKTKDVLVEFYAPWCGHCKKLAPIWDELGLAYSHAKDKIIIAKIDATENDLPPGAPFKIGGYPTIKLIKAGDNDIVEYQGDRTLDKFIEFLTENAVNKVEVSTPSPDTESATDVPAPSKESEEEEEEDDHEATGHDEL